MKENKKKYSNNNNKNQKNKKTFNKNIKHRPFMIKDPLSLYYMWKTCSLF